MDKVTVIGGSGFLGSHVADELSRRGFSVTIFDKNPSLWLTPDQHFVQGDLLDQALLADCCEKAKYVYHFGGSRGYRCG